jgi:uncharacterized protein
MSRSPQSDSICLADARRIALTSQGFAAPRARRVDAARLARTLRSLAVLQLDFVNVLVPAHYLIPFSRLGPYDRALLDEVIYRSGEFTEVMAHEASIIPVEHWPLVRQRSAPADRRARVFASYMSERADYAARVLEAVRAGGPISAEEAPDHGEPDPRDRWGWGLSVAKVSLDLHFLEWRLAVVSRRADYSRVYDLVERVIPAEHHAREVSGDEAERELLLLGARALGIGTAADIADYYRLPIRSARRRVAELATEGLIREVRVEGWRDPAYVHPDAEVKAIDARALLSPFDPVVWFRPRAERLFGFDYRIEIYLPKEKRRWGYYVLPFLLDDRIVARVDLKADRANRKLLVLASYAEPRVKETEVAAALADEVRIIARWLELDAGIDVTNRGNLSRPLRGAILATRAR